VRAPATSFWEITSAGDSTNRVRTMAQGGGRGNKEGQEGVKELHR
jgi:hypothetical protein